MNRKGAVPGYAYRLNGELTRSRPPAASFPAHLRVVLASMVDEKAPDQLVA
jgi:hypothetical protein